MSGKDIYRIEIPKCDIQLEERFADKVEVTLWMTKKQLCDLTRFDDEDILSYINLLDTGDVLNEINERDIEDYMENNGYVVGYSWENVIDDIDTDEVLEHLEERIERRNKYRPFSDDYKQTLKTILQRMIKQLED